MLHQNRAAGLHAAHHSALRHRNISHQIAIQSAQRQQRQNALLRLLLADRLIGQMPELAVLRIGVQTSARDVFVSAERQAHILQRRQLVSQLDAELAAHRLEETLGVIEFIRWPPRTEGIYDLVGASVSAKRNLLIAVKLVPAARARSGKDEWWVQTAHPLGKRKLRKLLAAGSLVPLVDPS